MKNKNYKLQIKNSAPRVLFMGTPHIAAVILESLTKSPYKPSIVVTRPDKPRRRSKAEIESEVKTLALKNHINVFQPQNKIELEVFTLKEKPDLIIVCAFGMIITKKTLDAAKFGAINIHPSLLPKYRGPSPITAPILAGDRKIGTTIMLMNEKMDEGDIIAQKEISLDGQETTPQLTEKLAIISAQLLVETLPRYLEGKIKPQPQNHNKATYTKIIKKEDGKINFQKQTAVEIERMSRAFSPWPGVFAFWKNKKLDLSEIKVHNLPLEPGKITTHKNEILIGTKEGVIEPKYLKIEGKNKIAAEEFLRGYPNFKNSTLT